MRYLRLFLLQFQEVIEDRGRIFVWFLLATIVPLISILFWRGAGHIPGWTSEQIASYYLLAIVIYASIMCHHEEHIATIDIQEGGLTAYLLKPIPYIHLVFLNEICYRILQGGIGILLLSFMMRIFPHFFTITSSPEIFLFSCIIGFAALALTFLFKMTVGLLAFFMTETRGAFEAVNVVLTIFSGMVIPLAFLPSLFEKIISTLPFAYMVYFPVIAFEGRLTTTELWQVLCMQILWIVLFYIAYKMLWRAGIKQYTAVGQ
jgi:viologen exporter family transport system permease protein